MNFFLKNVLKIFFKKKIFKLALGFASVGAFLNIVGYSAYVFLTSLGGEPKKTMTILFVITIFFSFNLNKSFVWKSDNKYILTLIKYFALYIFGYFFNLLCLIIFVDNYELNHQIVQLICVILIAIFNFVIIKLHIFK